jgi:cobalt-zinc-cadmium efflux system membrane fusion protein
VRHLVLLVGLAALACQPEERAPERAQRAEGPRVLRLSPEALAAAGLDVVTASRADLRPSAPAAGFVTPDARRSVTVRTPAEGRVARVAVDAGTRVRRGETLFLIESSEASAALSRHTAAVGREDVARQALERAEGLLAMDAISRSETERRRVEAEAAAAEARAARQDLRRLGVDPSRQDSRLEVVAPMEGTVLEVSGVEGGLVERETPLAVVGDLSRVWALVEVPVAAAGAIEPATEVEVRSPDLPGAVFSGRVGLVEPVVSAATARLRVRIVLDNPGGELRPGLFVSTELPLAEPPIEGTAVPSDAIQRFSGVSAVFVETGPGTFELRPVETGREAGGRVEVRRGLRDGERVVARGSFVLKSELLESSIAAEDDE